MKTTTQGAVCFAWLLFACAAGLDAVAQTEITPSHAWVPAVLGRPTNSLQAGVSIEEVSTNEYNHYSICLGFTNSSATNQPRNWMLPDAEKCFAVRLLDKKGREVDSYHQPLPENLNIRHLGKDVLANIGGIIPFVPNTAVQLAKFNLDDYVKIPPPGDYELEVEERVYQIADDGRLIPAALPPVVMDFKVIDQPSELSFYLNEMARLGKLHWGPASNSVRVGILLRDPDPNTVRKQMVFEVYLQNLGGAEIRDLHVPRIQEQFEISLSGPSGEEVVKTIMGNRRGLPLEIKDDSSALSENFVGGPQPTGTRTILLPPRDAVEISIFNLNDIFEIKAPGKYTLKFQQRLYQFIPTIRPIPLIMPAVIIPLDTENPP